ncbi:MAG: hypothetical protein PHO91_00905 [Patescibacteria group bacterium]|nr:hypothetical protein [Patescibacteria group bacterium]
MENNIKQILEDLYAIDKDMKKYEKELIKIIKALIASRPEASYDENFRQKLRADLLQKFSQRQESDNNFNKKFNFNFMKKINYVFGAVLLAVLVITPLMLLQRQSENIQLDFSPQISRVGANAFGQLGITPSGRGAAEGGDALMSDRSVSSETSIEPTLPAAPDIKGYGGGGGTVDGQMMILPPEYTYYEYNFLGEFPEINSQLDVLKRTKNIQSAGLNSVLSKVNLGLVDLGSFSRSEVRNFSLVQNQRFGYEIYINLYDQSISINQNWPQWQEAFNENSYMGMRIDQVPADDRIISLANKFLADYKIDLSMYGSGEIEDSWRILYARAENKSDVYIPPSASVVYPLIVNGKTVYDESGNSYGIRVSVDFNTMRVTGVWGIEANKYQSSSYAMETDQVILEKFIRQGGLYPTYYDAPGVRKETIDLTEMQIAYVKIWSYSNGENNEFLVPAIVLPIPEESRDSWKRNIVIPLSKDVITERTSYLDEPVRIMQ